MRLSAPLHTNLHPINRHTAGAAGKLIFSLFLPSRQPPPAPSCLTPAWCCQKGFGRVEVERGAGWGFVEPSPCLVAALGCSSHAIPQSWRFGHISRGPALSMGLCIPPEGRRGVVSPLLRGDDELPSGVLASELGI